MTTALTVALIGSVIANVIQYRETRGIKRRYLAFQTTLADIFTRMQDVISELSFLKGETEGVKNTQEVMKEAMSILKASDAPKPVKPTTKKRRRGY